MSRNRSDCPARAGPAGCRSSGLERLPPRFRRARVVPRASRLSSAVSSNGAGFVGEGTSVGVRGGASMLDSQPDMTDMIAKAVSNISNSPGRTPRPAAAGRPNLARRILWGVLGDMRVCSLCLRVRPPWNAMFEPRRFSILDCGSRIRWASNPNPAIQNAFVLSGAGQVERVTGEPPGSQMSRKSGGVERNTKSRRASRKSNRTARGRSRCSI